MTKYTCTIIPKEKSLITFTTNFPDEKITFQTFGIPATISLSMPHSSWPRMILKKPWSPQSLFQELAISQYGVPSSSPHPIILMAWPPSGPPVSCWQTPVERWWSIQGVSIKYGEQGNKPYWKVVITLLIAPCFKTRYKIDGPFFEVGYNIGSPLTPVFKAGYKFGAPPPLGCCSS